MLSRTPATILSFVAAICGSSTLSAQLPGDECTGALAVGLGSHGPFSTSAATTSSLWPCALGGNDVWFRFTPTSTGTATVDTCGGPATLDTCIEVLDGAAGCSGLVSISCNDDTCGLQSSVSWAANAGHDYFIRVGGFNGSRGDFSLGITIEEAFGLVATAEATPNTLPLAGNGSLLRPGEFVRWNFDDPNDLYPGNFAAVALNLGNGVQPLGATPGLPGLEVLHSGSSPAGFAFILPPHIIGAADYVLTIPGNLFQIEGGSLRIQGIVLNLAASPLPVTPTDNAITFTYTLCQDSQDFEGLAPGAGQYPFGWTNGGGVREWSAMTGATPSSGTGPAAAASGSGYLYCETSSPATGTDTFVLDSAIYQAAAAPMGTLEFFNSRVGSAMGALEVRLGDGTGTFPIVLLTFAAGINTTSEWDLETIALPAQVRYQFRFHYTYGGALDGDQAIDKLCLK